MTLSPRLPSRIWAIQKRNKRCIPREGCHMPKRHVKKKSANEREKMHTQRKYVTCPQDMLKEKKKKTIYIQSKSAGEVQEKATHNTRD